MADDVSLKIGADNTGLSRDMAESRAIVDRWKTDVETSVDEIDFDGVSSEVDQASTSLAAMAVRLTTIVGLAVAVYNAVRSWSIAQFNKELVRTKQLMEDVAEAAGDTRGREIDRINRLPLQERFEELVAQVNVQRQRRDTLRQEVNRLQQKVDSPFGFFQWELGPQLEEAKMRLGEAEDSLNDFVSARNKARRQLEELPFEMEMIRARFAARINAVRQRATERDRFTGGRGAGLFAGIQRLQQSAAETSDDKTAKEIKKLREQQRQEELKAQGQRQELIRALENQNNGMNQ